MSIRNAIAKVAYTFAYRVATAEGWDGLANVTGGPSMRSGLQTLKQRGIDIRRVIDGGACMGHWTVLLKSIYPYAKVLMLEPQIRHAEALKEVCDRFAPDVSFRPALLGPHAEVEVCFTVLDDHSGGTGSSMFAENSDVPRHTERMSMTTIDDLVRDQRFYDVDLIKLDVQGFELEVLKGATRTLQQTSFVLLEVSVWQYNEGSPLISEVFQWMSHSGFVAQDVVGLSRRSDGQLLQVDILFIRNDHPLLSNKLTHYGHEHGDPVKPGSHNRNTEEGS